MPIDNDPLTDQEIDRLNRIQRDFFSGLIHVFDPPLPDGVPARLEKIVDVAAIQKGNVVLDVGAGTGVLVPLIDRYKPKTIYASDLSRAMLEHLGRRYPFVRTIVGDIRDVLLPDGSIDVVFMNACYPNIVDKNTTLGNIARMMKPGGRMVVSHPMGKSFIDGLKKRSPFPLDDFPDRPEAEKQFRLQGFDIAEFIDETDLYILLLIKRHKTRVQGK